MPDSPPPPPPVVLIPSDRVWIDPRLIAANLFTQPSNVVLDMGAPTLLVGLNADRWAVGFARLTVLGPTVAVAPWGDVTTDAGQVVAAGAFVWYDQLTYGPLVGGEWYGYSASPDTVRVVEVIRLDRRT